MYSSILIQMTSELFPKAFWRGGRVVEGAALEMLYRGNPIEGSNPSLSVPQGYFL